MQKLDFNWYIIIIQERFKKCVSIKFWKGFIVLNWHFYIESFVVFSTMSVSVILWEQIFLGYDTLAELRLEYQILYLLAPNDRKFK